MQSLDASRPWIIYWCVHAMDMMQHQLSEAETKRCVLLFCKHRLFDGLHEQMHLHACTLSAPRWYTNMASECVILLMSHLTGGFGGGPGQLAHLAPTYAAVNALAILGSEGLAVIDRFVAMSFMRCRLFYGACPNSDWLMCLQASTLQLDDVPQTIRRLLLHAS